MTSQYFSTSRRALLTALSAAAVMALSGCGDKAAPTANAPASTASPDLLGRVLAKGEITIATEGTWAPWTYHDDKGNLTGFDVELGRLIASKLGVKAHFIEGKWDGLLAGVNAGRFDIMINGVDMTPERENAFLFTKPYVYNRTVVMTRGNSDRVKSLTDLKGLNTANTISSTYAAVAEKYGAKVVGVDDLNQTFELLLAGRIDATLNAEVTYYDYKRAHPNADIKIATIDPDVIPVGIPMKSGPDSAGLKSRIDEILAQLRASGELGKLSTRFFGSDLTKN